MRGVRWVGTALACLLLVACGAASAGAASLQKVPAKPITLSTAQYDTEPDVAVDAGGVGHIAWTDGVPGQPNVLKYCRLPRGATACQRTESWTIPASQFSRVRVLLGRTAGQVVILAERCCEVSVPGFAPDDVLWATVSGDGGASFAAPKAIGSGDPSGDAIFGPGDFGVTTITAVVTNGTIVQNAPLDGLTSAQANLTGGVADKAFYGSLALINPTTPMAAYSDLNTGTYWRVWSGAGDINDAGSWGPEGKIPGLDEPRIAGGPKGVWMKGMTLGPLPRFLTARRYDPTNNTWGTPTTLSNTIDSPVFSDISQDAGGHVAVVWRSSREDEITVQYRATSDGKSWTAARPLVRGDDVVNPQIGTGPDGGGFVVWDHNNQGPVRAAVIPPLGTGSGSGTGSGTSLPCEDKVTFNAGKVVVVATNGCLQKKKDGSYETHDSVRVNGLDILPVGAAARAAGAHAAGAQATITVDPARKTVDATGSVETRAGTVRLDKGGFHWTIPNGSKVDVGTFSDLGKFKVSLLGFPIVGTAELRFTPEGTATDVHLKLPFGNVTADATLRTNGGGLVLDGLHVTAGDLFLGALELKNLDVVYQRDPGVFEGSAKFLLPPTYTARDEARLSFGFENGSFKHAEVSRFPLNPALQLYPPFLSLTAIGFGLEVDPFVIHGGVELAAGPVIDGEAAIKIDALPPEGFTFAFTDPALFKVSGTVEVVGLKLGGGFVSFRTDGLLQFGGGLDFRLGSLISIKAGVATSPPDGPAFIDLSSGRFSAVIEGNICIPTSCFISAGGKGAISSRGMAICGSVSIAGFDVNVGGGYQWGDSVDIFGGAGGCDVSDYTEQAPARRAGARAAPGPGEVAVPGGLPQANFQVRGTTALPAVRLVGPDGAEIVASPAGGAGSPGVNNGKALLLNDPESKGVLIVVPKPAAGTYRVEALPGSPSTIEQPKVATGLPDAAVTARLGGHGYARTLTYKVRTIPGQTVRFAERAAGAGGELGVAKGAAGTLRFAPSDGAPGRRQVVALVEQNGLPRTEIVVGSYVAPANRRAGRPGHVRVRRAGSGLKVTWRTAARADAYLLRISLKDGRRQQRVVSRRARAASFPGVSKALAGKVTVAGLRLGPRPGPSASARVKAVKKKKRRR